MKKIFKNIYICSSYNGCALNSCLLTKIYNFLIANGYKIVKKSNDSDLIIIGTCANDNFKEKEAINFINGYVKKYSNRKKIIVTGCLPKINPVFFDKKNELIPVGVKQIAEFNRIFGAKKPIEKFKIATLNKDFCVDEDYADNSYYEYYSPLKYYVEISQGCLNNCSYCAIKKAKENLQSKTIDSVIEEFKKGIKLGFKKFVLLGDECGGYGTDIKTDFSELLYRISKLKANFEISIHNLEPSRLINLRPFLKNILPKIKLTSVTLPLQSGSPRILKLMNRHYNPQKVIKLVKDIKNIIKTEFITHFIYCFPSESRKEFMVSINLAKVFDKTIFFLYTKKKGTLASNFKKEISRNEKKYRTEYIKKFIRKNPKKYYLGTEKIPSYLN
jgi:MiaB/RimO family radical SAM methylthiotransferase